MKKKALTLILILTMTLLMIPGCGQKENSSGNHSEREEQEATEDETEQDNDTDSEDNQMQSTGDNVDTESQNADNLSVSVPDAYLELLDSYAAMLAGEDVRVDGYTGVWELFNGDAADAAAHVGYTFDDMNGDGNPELIIGYHNDETDNAFNNRVLAVYSYVEEGANVVLEGWARNRYYYLGSGLFLSSGSSGASSSCTGVYALEDERLVVRDFYFTEVIDDNYEEIGVYYNTTGEWDDSSSELLPMSVDEFWQIEEEIEPQIVNLGLIPLERGQDYSEAYFRALSIVNAAWAEDVLDVSNMEMFIADESQPVSKVVFSTGGVVTDFKVLALTLEDVTEDGNIIFSTEVIYSVDELTKENPLLVQLTFYGTVPYYGISYTDANGVTRQFAIDESGEDGSVILWEF